MDRRRILLVLVPVLLFARVGFAESRDAKERTARTACLAGDYAQGVRLLSELFVATKNWTFIYNQGRCFEQNRRYEDAIARFQEYLRAGKNLSASEEADAQKHIAGCKELPLAMGSSILTGSWFQVTGGLVSGVPVNRIGFRLAPTTNWQGTIYIDDVVITGL